jgi:4-amino-4-deoxy-L-arabinose transferase-like glycosyltransferase
MLSSMLERIELKTEKVFARTAVPLGLILLSGFLLRLFFVPFDLPSRSSDAFVFLLHALDFHNSLNYIGGSYFMWSGLLAIFFLPFQFNEYDSYFTVLELVSISVSTLSALILYFVAKKVLSKKFALLAVAFFVIEPNIVENSVFGLTEPLFTLIGLASFYFALQKDMRFFLLSFVFAGLALDTRPNGIVLFIVALVSLYLQRTKKEFLKFSAIGVLLFLAVSTPVLLNESRTGHITLLDVNEERRNTPSFDLVSGYSDNIYVTAVITDILHLFRISVPYLILFAPIGFLVAFKRLDWQFKLIITAILTSMIIAVPQYTYSVEYRNLFFITPFLAIFAAVGVEHFTENKNARNLFIILLVIGLLIVSYNFLRERQPDPDLLLEKEHFGKFIVANFKGNISGEEWIFIQQNMRWISQGVVDERANPLYFIDPNYVIYTENDLIEFLKESEIDYLIVGQGQLKRFKIFTDVYYNEKDYPYLEKVFDSQNNGYKKYHNKVFKVNQDILLDQLHV